MKILVTGGAGFIGSRLVDRLVDGHEVCVLDNLVSGMREWVNPEAAFINGDIRDADDVKKAIKGCGLVFHLAAIADARSSDENNMYAVDFLGSKNVFDEARTAGAKIVFASSAAVYGDCPLPNIEGMNCQPLGQYGKSKLRAEKICPEGSLVLRFFNVYGPRGHGVINLFAKKIPGYGDITVYGTGMQTRDYVYVDDVVNALMLGFEHSGLYNVGTGIETNVLDIIDIIQKISGKNAKVRFTMPKQEIQRSRADIKKISGLWKPTFGIKEGIKQTLLSG